ncbi:LexA/Signal peptidase [Karstenula rhodostoma CBS 690.94]|uniref:Mitochondrial inner membrane protease subunit n=1 Tax=Karstenula rhodostoma CBS 690.94 TaxID=1392251 RepID=A0A9P4PVB9_9PLEO|nr:LexA/Signal peptidase [Karstenula rhodostoma CBS 690.94]
MPPPRIRPSLLLFSAKPPRPHTPFFTQRLHPQRTHTLTTLFSRLRLTHSSAPTPVRSTWRIVKNTAKSLLVIHLFMTYIGTIGPTHGISMVPTIPHSYRSTPFILVSHLHRRGRNIAVGDVITYHTPAKTSIIGCKRVVGMPGDFVSVLSGGRENEDLGKADDEGDWANVKEEVVRVPEGHVWLAGDNLDWSRDSRVFGAVPLNLVRGKVEAVVWPPSAWKMLGGEEGLRDATDEEYEPLVTR